MELVTARPPARWLCWALYCALQMRLVYIAPYENDDIDEYDYELP